MQIPLEDLEYQRRAIAAVVGVLVGQTKNTFDNSNFFGIQANLSDLTSEQIEANKRHIIAENSIADADAKLSPEPEICIEMETGTGKTLVYLRTAYELHKEYRLTKFIVLVPSIAIKEGGMIRTGFSADLDELRAAATAGRQWLAEYQLMNTSVE